MQFDLKSTSEGWVLSIDGTNWVYPTRKRALDKIKMLMEEYDKSPENLQERINRGIREAGAK